MFFFPSPRSTARKRRPHRRVNAVPSSPEQRWGDSGVERFILAVRRSQNQNESNVSEMAKWKWENGWVWSTHTESVLCLKGSARRPRMNGESSSVSCAVGCCLASVENIFSRSLRVPNAVLRLKMAPQKMGSINGSWCGTAVNGAT